MRALLTSFKQFLLQISLDGMLIVIILAPFATGAFFKFGIPIADVWLCEYFGKATLLSPYYLLLDIFLAAITPYMVCFVSAMVILEERDTNITHYLSVTPVGKSGYLLSRLVFPTVISAMFSVIMLLLFSLTDASISAAILRSVLTAPIGIIVALLIVSLSANKVEGMVFAKLGGLIMSGVVIPFFITGAVQYWGAFLPSFWVAKSIVNLSAWSLFISIVVTAVWIGFLYRKFNKRVS